MRVKSCVISKLKQHNWVKIIKKSVIFNKNESDSKINFFSVRFDYRHQNVTSIVDPRTERVKYLLL